MNKKYNNYISGLQLKDFQIILEEFDIYLDEEQQTKILSMIQNNQYALIHEQYQFVLENYIKKLTSDFTCQKLCSY